MSLLRAINSAVECLLYTEMVTGSIPVSPIGISYTMKRKKFNELIQKPLRFHHQDIHEELEELKGMIRDVSYQMQELQQSIRGAPIPTKVLPVSQPYQHPWWEYQRNGSYPCRNHLGGSVQATSINPDETRSRVPGTEEAA